MACVGTIWAFRPFRMGWRFNRNIVICTAYRALVISLNQPPLPAAKHRALPPSSLLAGRPALVFTRMIGITSHHLSGLHILRASSPDRSVSCLVRRARVLFELVTQSAISMTESQRSRTFWGPEPLTLD